MAAERKPQVTMRRPPPMPAAPPVPEAAAQRFLAGGPPSPPRVDAPEHPRASTDAPEHPGAGASTTRITRQDGRQLRRTTVHLDEDVDRALRAHRRAHGCDLSHTINKALRALLQLPGSSHEPP